MKRRPRAIAPALSPVRRLGMLALLLAFAFQAYIVQTHIHGQLQPASAITQVQGETPDRPTPNDPLDPATCKLCQELVHSAAVLTPAAPAMALLLNWAAAFFPSAVCRGDQLVDEVQGQRIVVGDDCGRFEFTDMTIGVAEVHRYNRNACRLRRVDVRS